jgi:hypothetical protein
MPAVRDGPPLLLDLEFRIPDQRSIGEYPQLFRIVFAQDSCGHCLEIVIGVLGRARLRAGVRLGSLNQRYEFSSQVHIRPLASTATSQGATDSSVKVRAWVKEAVDPALPFVSRQGARSFRRDALQAAAAS